MFFIIVLICTLVIDVIKVVSNDSTKIEKSNLKAGKDAMINSPFSLAKLNVVKRSFLEYRIGIKLKPHFN